jgi:hypothetical protein
MTLPCEGHATSRPLGSWPCKTPLRKEVGEKPAPVRSQATIAALAIPVGVADFHGDTGQKNQAPEDPFSRGPIPVRRATYIRPRCHRGSYRHADRRCQTALMG